MNSSHSAFPATEYYDERPIGGSSGLTKRELFAAIAMQGLLSGGHYQSAQECAEPGNDPEQIIAEDAARYADALIKALSKES